MRIQSIFCTLTLTALVSSGCISGNMRIDPVLKSNSSAMKIYNPNGPFIDGSLNFGPYSVWALEKQNAKERALTKHHSYSFWLTDEWSRHWETHCDGSIQNLAKQDQLGKIVSLNCEIAGADDVEKAYAWNVKLNGVHQGPNVRLGEIKNPRYQMRIESHYNDIDASRPAVGFDIYLGDKPVATVKTNGDNAVWIHDQLGGDARSAVAATATGLMLFDRVLQKS